jgi:uncharacterized linocin/CFP29 family protein
MSLLYRELAPISDRAWSEIDDEARRSIQHFLAGRHLFELEGPHGYDIEAVPTGDIAPAPGAALEGTSVSVLKPQPLVELRTPLKLSRRDIEVLDRGGDAELDAVVDAARQIAAAEDRLVFDGLADAGITGAAAGSPYETVALDSFPSAVAKAVTELRSAGIDGPYGIALSTPEHRRVMESSESGGGYPILNHLKLILEDGPVVWAPTLEGALVVSMRGGDFEIHSGLDFAIRYLSHDRDHVDLELVETVTFRNTGPDAAIRVQ